jgi:threonine dehydratase
VTTSARPHRGIEGLPVSPDDVARATRAVGNRLHRTPSLGSRTLGESFGGRAVLKAELFQRTGSFKPRGILAKIASLSPDERSRGVITISAGNAAAAVAFGAAAEGIDALVVMAGSASPAKVEATRGYGATVDLEAQSLPEAYERMEAIRRASGRTLVHPFDDPTVIAGHASLGHEIVEDVPDVDVVVVPVGGGGLISGVALGVKHARPEARIVAVEPEGSAALKLALEAGKPVPIEPVSVADGLNAPFAGDLVVPIADALVEEAITVTEDEIGAGFRFLYGRAKLAAEPAGAVSTAALLAGKVPGVEGKTVVAVVSGGNVAAKTATAILASDEA